MENIETSLQSIDALIAEAKTLPFSSKLLIDEEELTRIIADIRLSMPVEITQAKKIAQERRDILNDAEAKGEEIIAAARKRADIMIEEHQITKEAKNAADGILQQARDEANTVRTEAKAHAADIMNRAEKWSKDIRANASIYVEKVVKETDETLTDNIRKIKALRESVSKALAASNPGSRPDFD